MLAYFSTPNSVVFVIDSAMPPVELLPVRSSLGLPAQLGSAKFRRQRKEVSSFCRKQSHGREPRRRQLSVRASQAPDTGAILVDKLSPLAELSPPVVDGAVGELPWQIVAGTIGELFPCTVLNSQQAMSTANWSCRPWALKCLLFPTVCIPAGVSCSCCDSFHCSVHRIRQKDCKCRANSQAPECPNLVVAYEVVPVENES